MTAPAPARTAPPYRLVLRADAPRAEWLEARRRGIGSSDVPQILGVSSWGSAQHVYYNKRGELPDRDEVSEEALWGQLHEETVAREWFRRNRAHGRRVGLIARKDPGMGHHMCTLDRLAMECPLNRGEREKCAVEVKNRNAFTAGKWKRSIPDDVLAQGAWQLHVTGFDHIHVAVLIGNSDYRQFVVRRSEHVDLIGNIVTVVDRLWRDIALGHVPPLDGTEPVDAMLDLYDTLNPERFGFADLDEYPALSVAAIENLLAYETARLEAKAAKAGQDAAKVAMIAALGPHEAAWLNNEPAYELKPVTRRSCDMERLAEEFPEAYAACVRESVSKQLAIAKAHRLKELPS